MNVTTYSTHKDVFRWVACGFTDRPWRPSAVDSQTKELIEMRELVIRPSHIGLREVLIGELVDDEPDSFDEPGPCRGDGEPCGDYRCCRP